MMFAFFLQLVTFLLEDKLKELGGNFKCTDDWQPLVVQDGNLITGQNPASARPVGEAILKYLKDKDHTAAGGGVTFSAAQAGLVGKSGVEAPAGVPAK